MKRKTGILSQQKNLKKSAMDSLWTCLHHMVILRSQNKISDFFVVLDLGMSLYIYLNFFNGNERKLKNFKIYFQPLKIFVTLRVTNLRYM